MVELLRLKWDLRTGKILCPKCEKEVRVVKIPSTKIKVLRCDTCELYYPNHDAISEDSE